MDEYITKNLVKASEIKQKNEDQIESIYEIAGAIGIIGICLLILFI